MSERLLLGSSVPHDTHFQTVMSPPNSVDSRYKCSAVLSLQQAERRSALSGPAVNISGATVSTRYRFPDRYFGKRKGSQRGHHVAVRNGCEPDSYSLLRSPTASNTELMRNGSGCQSTRPRSGCAKAPIRWFWRLEIRKTDTLM